MPRLPSATITKEEFEKQYCQEKATLDTISKATGVPITTLSRWRRDWDLNPICRTDSYLGKKFGYWTVIQEQHGGHRGIPTICHCRCDCGKEADIPRGNLQQGITLSCGCLFQKPEGHGGFTRLLWSYAWQAKRRNLLFELTPKQVKNLTSQNCYYCGIPPQKTIQNRKCSRGQYTYNGIDRIDNSLGYLENNVVTACWECNIGKSTQTLKGFLNWVFHIHTPTFPMSTMLAPIQKWRTQLKNYKWTALSRKLNFNLTDEQASYLFQTPCAYCESPPNNGKPGHYYSGIDRIDNTKGYELDNCVPSCFCCNRAKKDRTLDQFLVWATRVQNYIKLQQSPINTEILEHLDQKSPIHHV